MKKLTRGGKRTGSGRPKLKKSEKKEATKVIRIPKSWSKKVFIVYNDDGGILVKGRFS